MLSRRSKYNGMSASSKQTAPTTRMGTHALAAASARQKQRNDEHIHADNHDSKYDEHAQIMNDGHGSGEQADLRRQGLGLVDPQTCTAPAGRRSGTLRKASLPRKRRAPETPGGRLRILPAIGLHQLVDPGRGQEWHTEEIGQDLGLPGHIGEVAIVGHEHVAARSGRQGPDSVGNSET